MFSGVLDSKRAAGIEPALLAWKAKVLPLNYARKSNMLEAFTTVTYFQRKHPIEVVM